MTQGQMMFLSGAVLLLLTIVLAIIFIIKKPRYSPEQFEGTDNGATSRFRNGYPTDRLTKRYPLVSEAPAQSVGVEEETEHLQESSKLVEETEHLSESAEVGEATERLQGTSEFCAAEGYPRELDLAEQTEPLQGSSELSEETERLTGTTEFGEATVSLQETGDLSAQMKSTGEETQKLNEDN